MASVGELVVNIRVNSEEKKVKDFQNSIKQATSSLRNFRAAISAVRFATRLLERNLSGIVDFNKQISDTAQSAERLGVLPETFIRFQERLKLANIEASRLGKVFGVIAKLQDDFLRGGEGENKAINTLGELNLELLDTEGKLKSSAQIFDEILKRINELPAENVRLADDIFGGTGLLQDINRKLPQARINDITTPPVVNIDAETIANADALNKELNLLSANFNDFKREITPLITLLAQIGNLGFSGTRKGFKTLGSAFVPGDFGANITGFRDLAAAGARGQNLSNAITVNNKIEVQVNGNADAGDTHQRFDEMGNDLASRIIQDLKRSIFNNQEKE